jgi:hypothetical protein
MSLFALPPELLVLTRRFVEAHERQAVALERIGRQIEREADALHGISGALASDADSGGTLDALAVAAGKQALALARTADVQERQAAQVEQLIKEFRPALEQLKRDLNRPEDGEAWKGGNA